MQRKPSPSAVFLLIGLMLFQGLAPDLQAQTAPPTPQQLDQLLAPIALYPDSLLAQITTASTNPQEILDVDQWLAQNRNLTVSQLTNAAQQQGFDPAFIALVSFPQVLEMMAENIDDYAAIGAAVSANQEEVSASIQRLRAQAYASGALRSNQQQQVEVQQYAGQPIYVIQPANPQVVYVPQYDPTVVYAGPGGAIGAAPLIVFGIGIALRRYWSANPGVGVGGDGIGEHAVFITTMVRGADGMVAIVPAGPGIGPRPVVYRNHPGFGGNWRYRPPNYRPPTPINKPGYSRPGGRPPYTPPGNRPINRPNPSRPGQPSIQPVRPGTPNNRPPNRPVNGPGNNRPGNGGVPSIQPVKPGTPNNRPPNRPSGSKPPQERPAATQNRPAPRPQNQQPRPQQPKPQQQGGDGQRGPR